MFWYVIETVLLIVAIAGSAATGYLVGWQRGYEDCYHAHRGER